MNIQFVCMECGTVFEEEVTIDQAELFTDIQEACDGEVLQSVCRKCRGLNG